MFLTSVKWIAICISLVTSLYLIHQKIKQGYEQAQGQNCERPGWKGAEDIENDEHESHEVPRFIR
jgi:hypothetical protein